MHAPVTHGRSLQGLRRQQVGGKAERTDVGGQVPHPQRSRQVPQVLEEPRPVRPGRQQLVFVGRDAGGDEVLGLPAFVEGGDSAVSGAGQGAGALDDLVQDGVEVEAGADAQDGRAQPGDAVSQRLVLSPPARRDYSIGCPPSWDSRTQENCTTVTKLIPLSAYKSHEYHYDAVSSTLVSRSGAGARPCGR